MILSVVEEEECSKSRQGTKRKAEGEAVQDAAATPSAAHLSACNEQKQPEQQQQPAVDMTQLVASLKPAPTAAPAKVAWGGAGLAKPAVTSAATPTVPSTIAAAPVAATSAASVHQPLVKRQRRNDGAVAAPAPQLSRPSSLARPASFLGAVTGAAAAAAPSTPVKSAGPSASQRAMRAKQIAIGKSTVGYQNYVATVPLHARLPIHPRTPDPAKACSKRAMDGQLRQWRRLLHEFDPEVIEARKNGTYVEPSAAMTAAAQEMMEEEAADASSVAESDGELVEKSSAAASDDSFVIVQ
jgi:hypothetical protein